MLCLPDITFLESFWTSDSWEVLADASLDAEASSSSKFLVEFFNHAGRSCDSNVPCYIAVLSIIFVSSFCRIKQQNSPCSTACTPTSCGCWTCRRINCRWVLRYRQRGCTCSRAGRSSWQTWNNDGYVPFEGKNIAKFMVEKWNSNALQNSGRKRPNLCVMRSKKTTINFVMWNSGCKKATSSEDLGHFILSFIASFIASFILSFILSFISSCLSSLIWSLSLNFSVSLFLCHSVAVVL